jgi:selenocysteine-specific translation elongation factor
MKGNLVGVFGVNQALKTAFENSIAKKNESEGMLIYLRSEGGNRLSLLDDLTYPEKIQGYARVASICDYAYYIFPKDGKLSAADGEIAVLLDSFSLEGSIQVIDSSASAVDQVRALLKDVIISSYAVEERSSQSSIMPRNKPHERKSSGEGTLIYIDRAFNVKGVGVVVLGFVLSGKVSIHDKLRMIPGASNKLAEVRGIQVNDEEQESVESGLRVGLSLKGVDLKDLDKTAWLDDGTYPLARKLAFELKPSKYYKQPTVNRDLHVQLNGDLLVSRVIGGPSSTSRIAELQHEVPLRRGMRLGLIDLNSKPLRIIGGGIISE